MKKKAAPILIAIMMEKRVTTETVPNLKHVPAKLVGKKILALDFVKQIGVCFSLKSISIPSKFVDFTNNSI